MAAQPQAALARRAMAIDDLYRLRVVTEISTSYDGTLGAAVVQRSDRNEDVAYSEVYALDLHSGRTWAVASGHYRDSAPRWSPTLRKLAFISNRPSSLSASSAGATSIFTVDFDHAGEPRPVGIDGAEISDFCWAPSGDTLCVVLRPLKETAVGEADARVYDRMPFFHPLEGWLDNRYYHLWLVSLNDGRVVQLTDGECNDHSPVWSSTGEYIAFVSSRGLDRERTVDERIWLVPSRGGKPRCVSARGFASASSPSFSPDGTEIAFYGPADDTDPARAARQRHLLVARIDNGDVRDVTEDWDRPVGNLLLTETRPLVRSAPAHWSTNGSHLYFIASDGGSVRLYEVSACGGVPSPLSPADAEVVSVAPLPEGRFAAVIGDASRPAEVFTVDPRDGSRSQLTHFNDELLSELQLTLLEPFALTGADGWPLEGWILKPPDFDESRQYPLILRITGGPGFAYGHSFVEDCHILAGAGNVVAFINPRGTHTYGRKFAEANIGDWLGKDYEDQMLAVDALLDRGFIHPQRLGCTGASYGGLMVNWIVTQTDRFAAAVSQRSISNLISLFSMGTYMTDFLIPEFAHADPYRESRVYWERSPLAYAAGVKTPLMLIQAGEDYITPVDQALEFFVALRHLGKPARLVVYPTEQHYLRRYGKPSNRAHYLHSLVSWFQEQMPAEEEIE